MRVSTVRRSIAAIMSGEPPAAYALNH